MVLFRLVMYGSIQNENFIGGSNHLLELRHFLSFIRSFLRKYTYFSNFSYTLMVTVRFDASIHVTIKVC